MIGGSFKKGQELRKLRDNSIVIIKKVNDDSVVLDGEFEPDHVVMLDKIELYYSRIY